ncbi:MAG: hypothetical protein JW861_05505 [Bacteroidales bacterium]|nr:hypothetical protein [Bacteroidales bacterium]
MKNHYISLSAAICFIFFQAGGSFGQAANLDTLKAENIGDTVYMPLEFYGLINVGAFSLWISYDTTVLQFIDIDSLIPEASGTLANSLIQNNVPVVGLSWLATSGGVDFPDGKFLDIRFVYLGGTSDLDFTDQCEVVDWEATPINVTYTGGSVSQSTTETVELEKPDARIWSSDRMVNIQASDLLSNAMIEITDLSGRIHFSEFFMKFNGLYQIPLELSNQVVIVRLISKEGMSIEKLLVR